MVLRRTGERRRRVVMDEALQTPTEAGEASAGAREEVPKGRRPRQYSRNADRRNLPRCADFIPVGRIAVLAAWCGCLGTILALNLGFGFLGSRPVSNLPLLSAAFGSGPCSFGSWLQVLAWAGAGICCLVIFSVRQHRSNDFRGTYRLWRWLAIGCLLLSLNVLVDLVGISAELVGWLTGKTLATDAVVVLSLQTVVVLGAAIRLLFELRHSRSATALAALAGLSALASCWLQLDSVGDSLASNRELVVANLEFWTSSLALMSLLVYARFVILHASGAVYVPEKSAKRKSKKRQSGGKSKRKTTRKRTSKPVVAEDEESEEEDWSESEEEETESEDEEERSGRRGGASRASSRGGSKSSGNQRDDEEDENETEADEDDEDESNQSRQGAGLSRAERRRLKREQRQGRRAA